MYPVWAGGGQLIPHGAQARAMYYPRLASIRSELDMFSETFS